MNYPALHAPLTTPFADDGRVLYDRLQSNIALYNETRLDGYVILGSTGEAVFLNTREKREVLKQAREAASDDRLLIAGTAEESLRGTLEMTSFAAKLGYDAVLVRTPHYYKPVMTAEALVRFYRDLADASPLPVLLYNFPQLTGLDLSVDVIAQLAEHPNIAGIKDSSGNLEKLASVLVATAEMPARPALQPRRQPVAAGRAGQAGEVAQRPFEAWVGSAATYYPALCGGARGAILGLAVAAPQTLIKLRDAVVQGDHAHARNKQEQILEACAITGKLGLAAVKFAMDLNGYYGGAPRLPILPLSPEQRKQVQHAFRAVKR
jgi:dihydrodipicolinate synthase/N-acetylneuraminate lyase